MEHARLAQSELSQEKCCITASQLIVKREKSKLWEKPHKTRKTHGVKNVNLTPNLTKMQPFALIQVAQLKLLRLRPVNVSNAQNSMVLTRIKLNATKRNAQLRTIRFLESMEDARFVLHSNILILLANYAYLILALVTRSLRKMVDVILVMLVPDQMKLAEHARKILVIS